MNDEELIEQLRDSKGWQNLGNAAADRIEQLSAELKMVLEREAETHRRHEAREDAAEAKLAKAVEFIQEVRRNGDTRLASMAIAVLAELEKAE